MTRVGDPDFHLKNNNHLSALAEEINFLYEDERLLDVTLSTAGGKSLKAHRLVLHAFSEYFEVCLHFQIKIYIYNLL